MSPSPAKSSGILLPIGFFVLFVLGIASIALVTGWRESLAALSVLTIAQVVVLLSLSLVNYGCRALRWTIYTRAMRLPTGWLRNFTHYMAGFAMTATPARLGEFIRLRWIWRETGLKPDATGALIIVDRAADLTAVGLSLAITVGLATSGLAGASTAAILAVSLAFAVTRPSLIRWGTAIVFSTFGKRLPRVFGMIRRAARKLVIFTRLRVFLPATGLGLIGWCAEAYSFYLLLSWMGAEVGMAMAMAIFFLSMLTGGATGMPGGIGGAEAAMIAALLLNNVPLEIALPATAVIRLTTLWFAIALGLLIFPFAERPSLRQGMNQKNAVESSNI